MKRKWILPIALLVLLLASNAWWAYRLLDAGVSNTYLDTSLTDNETALNQVLALLPCVAKPDVSKDELISVARKAAPNGIEPFEKEGYVWIGSIGLKFNQEGKLVEVKRAWEQ
jgi:hypothetical protein